MIVLSKHNKLTLILRVESDGSLHIGTNTQIGFCVMWLMCTCHVMCDLICDECICSKSNDNQGNRLYWMNCNQQFRGKWVLDINVFAKKIDGNLVEKLHYQARAIFVPPQKNVYPRVLAQMVPNGIKTPSTLVGAVFIHANLRHCRLKVRSPSPTQDQF